MSRALRAVLFDWRGTLFLDEDEADWIRASAASVGRTLTSGEVDMLGNLLAFAGSGTFNAYAHSLREVENANWWQGGAMLWVARVETCTYCLPWATHAVTTTPYV
jgi:hypothetical protein